MPANTRRRLLQVAGVGLASSLAGCTGALDRLSGGTDRTTDTATRGGTPTATERPGTTDRSTTDRETTTDRPEDTTGETTDTEAQRIADQSVFDEPVPLPARPSNHRYAVVGDPESGPTATVFGSWKCPFTAEFVVELLPSLVDEFVRTGDVAIEFRSLASLDGEPFLGPDAPRASRAGLAVWEVDPDSFWPYLATVFANQPPEERTWADADRLARFARAAGVDRVDSVRTRLAEDGYRRDLEATVTRAPQLGISTVPRVATSDTVTAPTVDFEATRRQLAGVADR